jgi:hypothetical protein
MAQAMVESGANPYAKGKHKEKGAWQIREKYWGKVPKDMVHQARQAEGVLDVLIKENHGDIYKAVRRYNGYSRATKKYANAVRSNAIRLAVVGV